MRHHRNDLVFSDSSVALALSDRPSISAGGMGEVYRATDTKLGLTMPVSQRLTAAVLSDVGACRGRRSSLLQDQVVVSAPSFKCSLDGLRKAPHTDLESSDSPARSVSSRECHG